MVVVLVVLQLVLPGIVARQLRDRFSRSGKVISVQVDAFPAIELLWHHADRVDVHLASYRASTGGLGKQLDQTAEVGTVDVTVEDLNLGLVTLRDATLRKRGDVLSGRATLTEADLRAALPPGLDVQPVASGDGKLVLQASALGLSAFYISLLTLMCGFLGGVITGISPCSGLTSRHRLATDHKGASRSRCA